MHATALLFQDHFPSGKLLASGFTTFMSNANVNTDLGGEVFFKNIYHMQRF